MSDAFLKFALINTVPIALAPIEAGCFSSGFGPRGGRTHKGIEYYSHDPVNIYAAGHGNVIEETYRDDYGRMIIIDHGHGVYTRYAHLEKFEDGLLVGHEVEAGRVIGIMGNSASYRIPRHLHYEVLVGDYDTPKKSFGLEPIDIYKQ